MRRRCAAAARASLSKLHAGSAAFMHRELKHGLASWLAASDEIRREQQRSARALECMQRNESKVLVRAMHAIGDSYGDYPTILINGQPDAAIPEPDTHRDRVEPLIREVCRRARGAG